MLPALLALTTCALFISAFFWPYAIGVKVAFCKQNMIKVIKKYCRLKGIIKETKLSFLEKL